MAEEEITEEVEQLAETEKTESVAEPETTEQETEPVEAEEAEKPQEKVYTKAEIDKIMSRRIAREKKKLQRDYEEKINAAKSEPSKETPKLEDFENTEDYLDAKARVIAQEEFNKLSAAQKKQAEAEREQKEVERIQSKYQEQQEEASLRHPDYDDALDALQDFDVPGYINEAVMDSDVGGELSYYLGKNLDEVEKILAMRPSAAVKYLGRLEDKISAKPPKKEISKVPAPIKPVNSTSKTEEMEIKDGMPYEQFARVREHQIGRR